MDGLSCDGNTLSHFWDACSVFQDVQEVKLGIRMEDELLQNFLQLLSGPMGSLPKREGSEDKHSSFSFVATLHPELSKRHELR